MIYAKLKNIERYLGQSQSLDTAIKYLLCADLSTLVKGHNDVDGDQVFINRFDYQTIEPDQAIWEGHEKYGDIHVLLSGYEKIGITAAEMLTATVRKPEEDFIGYEGPVQTWCHMTTEDILIVYPEDVHKVRVIDGESTLVQKACFKFKV